MLKRLWIYLAILLGLAFMILGYVQFKTWKFRQETLKELETFFVSEQEERNSLLAFGQVDLNPSNLTLSILEQRLKQAVLKKPGDFNTTRLGWACGKERCAIWASFLVPFGQDIPPNAAPAGLVIASPMPGDFPNIRIGEIRLGGSDKKLMELSKSSRTGSRQVFHRVSWDKDWTAAWAGLDGKVSVLVFSNDSLLRRLEDQRKSLPASTK